MIPPDALDLLLPDASPPADSWRWGTITSTSPLRVRLDGDTDPLDVDPDVLTIGMVTGERVYCQLHGRRLIAEHRSPAPFAKSCASLAAANAWYSLCVAQGQIPANDPVWVWRSDTLTLERNSGSGWLLAAPAITRGRTTLVVDANSSVTVAHGLGATPTNVMVEKVWSSSSDARQATSLEAGRTSTTFTFQWLSPSGGFLPSGTSVSFGWVAIA